MLKAVISLELSGKNNLVTILRVMDKNKTSIYYGDEVNIGINKIVDKLEEYQNLCKEIYSSKKNDTQKTIDEVVGKYETVTNEIIRNYCKAKPKPETDSMEEDDNGF